MQASLDDLENSSDLNFHDYWMYREKLPIQNDVFHKGSTIILSKDMHSEILTNNHSYIWVLKCT